MNYCVPCTRGEVFGAITVRSITIISLCEFASTNRNNLIKRAKRRLYYPHRTLGAIKAYSASILIHDYQKYFVKHNYNSWRGSGDYHPDH